ncbi:uncharacterized protein [Apostichopus japonicus]|uniref:uncharacterized protein isoform X2 n=1 Tax=Stichopus japonicus TaxID=307972 RepID=UPI003AB358F0
MSKSIIMRMAVLYIQSQQSEDQSFKDEYNNYEDMNQDCALYRILWLPEKDLPCSEKLWIKQAEVSVGGGEQTSFREATTEYIDEHFKDDGVYRVPPFWFHTDAIKRNSQKSKNDLTLYSDEELSELKTLLKPKQIENILTVRNADRAVESVVKILQKWAEFSSENMFIFTNYKYQDYLNNVKSNVLVTDIKGDHDIMAISQKYGVLFFQVKSCELIDNNYLNLKHKAQNAMSQAMKDKFVFLQSNRDLPYVTVKSPIYGFAALPNLQEKDLKQCNLCVHHAAVILTAPALTNINQFSFWLKNALYTVGRRDHSDAFSHQQFREICGRYVGLASSVSVPTVASAIHKSGKKLSLSFLTPVQLRVRNSNRKFMIIAGDTGTGKSLILASKARQICQQSNTDEAKCKINIITCTDINDSLFCALKMSYRSSQQLEKFLSNLKIKISPFRVLHENEQGQNFKVTPELLLDTIRKLTKPQTSSGGVQHIFMDEVPFELLKSAKELLEDEVENIPYESFVWMTVSTHTYRVDSRNCKDPRWIKDHMPSNFQFEYLDLVKRVPRSLFKIIKEIQAITGNGHSQFSKCGHVIDGLKPLLYRLQNCSCSLQQQEPDYMRCACVEERIYQTFSRIFRDLVGVDNMNDITIVLHNFAIHGNSFKDLKHLLDKTFNRLGIELIWSTVLYKSPIATDRELSPGNLTTQTTDDRQEVINNPDVNASSDSDDEGDYLFNLAGNLFKDQLQEGNCTATGEDPPTVASPVRRDEKRKGQIMVVDTRTFVGCEGKVLISLDQCGMFHHFRGERGVGWHRISLVRCVAQYIYVTWSEEEAAQNWRKYLNEYEMDVRARNNLNKVQLQFREDQISQGLAASYKTSCLEKLMRKDLFTEK